MKIVHLCLSAFFIDGYSYQENILPKYHVKMGYDVTVIASLFSFNKEGKGYFKEGFSEYDDINGFHVVRLQFKQPRRLNEVLRRYEKFGEILERESPDIIFSHNVSYADISVVVQYLKKHPNVKVYADNHADFINSAKNSLSRFFLHPVIWRYYAKKIEPYLDRCYGVTPMRCHFLKDMYHISPSIIDFLPMGVDNDSIPNDRLYVAQSIRKENDIPEDDFVIFTGGKIDKLKNTNILLSALQALNDRHIHLIICGTLTPEVEYLKNIIDSSSNIHYMGWCNAEKVMACMVASNIACFPGTHSTLWEQSVGIGLPAIFKRWDEMEHVNVQGNCIFVKGEDSDELSAAITSIISNYSSYKIAAERASNSFLYSNIAKKAIGL